MEKVKVRLEVTEGFEERYTKAMLEAYQKKADREGRTIGGVFHPRGRNDCATVPVNVSGKRYG